MKLIGIDTGGTFTDFVLYDDGALTIHKVLSTPEAPERAILQGIRELGLGSAGLRVIHGSTVATNAALEGKGVRTCYIGNKGLADLLTIGRQARRELYRLEPAPQPPPVPAALCLEADCRLAADAQVAAPLEEAELKRLLAEVERLRPEAVAINLLYSYLDPAMEQAIARVLPPGLFISLSSEVLPEIREYERGIATWLNAWIGPRVAGYLERLNAGLPGARVAVMQSSGETIAAPQAARQAVRLLLSGPAGGLRGAALAGEAAGRRKLLTFDMGGTSTDVALVDGEPKLTSEGRIGPYPVGVPMVDMHTIGAGGGSVAYLDAGGMLQVGPESAGAAPGPACYARGGDRPTVTDANLILGRLLPDAFLGGRMRLDAAAARTAMQPLAAAMGCTLEEAAAGVVRVADEQMMTALRVISVQRGLDPREFVLSCFGGAGGLHVCALAEALEIPRILAPVHGGVLSALGMLGARPGRQVSRTRLGLLSEADPMQINRELDELAEEGRLALEREGCERAELSVEYSLDLRYRGQSHTLNNPWRGVAGSRAEFEMQHERRYGHRIHGEVELVNLRAALKAPPLVFELEKRPPAPAPGAAVSQTAVFGAADPAAVYARQDLLPGQCIAGPALITEQVATTWLAPGWRAEADIYGNLLLDRHG